MRNCMSVTESVIRGNFLQSRLPVQCSPGCVNTGNKPRMHSTTLQMKILLHAFIGPSCFQAQRMLFYTTFWACAVQQHSDICQTQATPILFGRLGLSHGCVWEEFIPSSLGLFSFQFVKNSWCLQHRRYFVPQIKVSWKIINQLFSKGLFAHY